MKRALYIITVLAVGAVAYYIGVINGTEVTHGTATEEIDSVVIENEMDIVTDGFVDIDSEEFKENYIDYRTVTGYSGTDTGVQLYTADGNGFYIEVDRVG